MSLWGLTRFSLAHQYHTLLTASRLRRSCILLQRLPVLAQGRKEGSAYPAHDRAIIRAIRADDGGRFAIGVGQIVRHSSTFVTLHNTDLSCIATTPKTDGCSGECLRSSPTATLCYWGPPPRPPASLSMANPRWRNGDRSSRPPTSKRSNPVSKAPAGE
jgi:hypothetical protein